MLKIIANWVVERGFRIQGNAKRTTKRIDGKKDLLVTVAEAVLDKAVRMKDHFMAMIGSSKVGQTGN